MNETLLVAVLSLIGTLFGSLGGIVASGKLTSFRLSNLEKKMDEFSKTLQKIPLIEKEQQTVSLRVSALEKICESRVFPA